MLSPTRRNTLSKEILELATNYQIAIACPREIDEVVLTGKKFRKLNWLEAKLMAKVLRKLKPDIAYVDASDVVEKRFGTQISELLPFKLELVSEHRADIKYPIVSAASILAKTHRDSIISKLHKQYGDFGSGYCSDKRTIKFLSNWIETHSSHELPWFVRKSWQTITRLTEATKQTAMSSYVTKSDIEPLPSDERNDRAPDR
jgi:ribonuclease HII